MDINIWWDNQYKNDITKFEICWKTSDFNRGEIDIKY